MAFVPVTNLKLLLEVHKEQVGEPKDIGGSILEIGTDRKAFVKGARRWAFISEQKELPQRHPCRPAPALLRYAVEIQHRRPDLRAEHPRRRLKMAIDQIKQGMDAAAKASRCSPASRIIRPRWKR